MQQYMPRILPAGETCPPGLPCPPPYGWNIKSEKSERQAVTLRPPEDTDDNMASEVVLLVRLLLSRPPLRFLSLVFILVTEKEVILLFH